jgi:ribokinase
MNTTGAIVVFGSINMDLVARVPRLPAAGETISGHGFSTVPGGKGANQAVACARLGAVTRLVGRVGDDVFGTALLDSLRGYGVDTTGATTAPGSSGIAVINVDDRAENTIVIIAGANGRLDATDLGRLETALIGAEALLLQLEVPLEAVLAAGRLARTRGVRVILDPAPARPLPDELYALADVLTPNESEAAALVGFPVTDRPAAERAAQVLRARGARQVIIKMGALGAYAHDGRHGQLFPAFPVAPVDTVAAGDAFNGAFAVRLTEGKPFEEAVRWGLASGAIAVTRPGAQSAMPKREELERFLEAAPAIAGSKSSGSSNR